MQRMTLTGYKYNNNLDSKNINERKKVYQRIDSMKKLLDSDIKISNLLYTFLNMRHYIITILFLNSFLLLNGQYSLVWQDEFNGTVLDEDVWNYETNIGVWNTGDNKELEYYRKENVSVGTDDEGNNCLIITAKKESYNGYQFTSGRINTKDKFSFKYGKLEARIKMPDLANGLWPAFWTLGSVNGWPACGEIDILEMGHKEGISSGKQNQYLGGALHWENNNSHAMYYRNVTVEPKMNEGYHVFTVEWTPQSIKMSIDSGLVQYFVMTMPSSDGEEFTDYLHYLIFNLAVGGSLTGITTVNGITAAMPANMYVDWVRVYQKPGEGSINITTNNKFSKLSSNEKIRIYPNPSDGNISIMGLTGIVAVSIFELNGRKVKTDYSKTIIDISGLSRGIYILESNSQNESYRTLIIKQ
jgi:beta-glucanase (GH16 family)